MKKIAWKPISPMRLNDFKVNSFLLVIPTLLFIIMSVACSKDDGGISEPATVPVSSIKLNQTSVTLKPGESVELTATVSPANATDKTVKWSSSNTSIATVTDGKVTAKANGTATIKAQCGNVKAECSITVKTTEVTSIKLNQTSAELYEDETIQLSATVIPEDTSESIIWKSSDETVATVSEGKVYARKAGKADITASIDSGANAKTATCSVTVKCHVEGVSLRDHALTVKQGQKLQLSATVYPDRASNKAVSWSSAEPHIASVSETGMLEAKSSGTVTISVTTVEGGFKDDCVVTVISNVAGITLNKTELDLRVKETAQLTATVSPADATNKDVTWTSSVSTVATVDDKGKVTAVAPGEAVICVTTKDGGHKASCTVRVRSRVDEITLSEKEITLLTTDPKRTLTANVISADADFTLIWKSDNEAVATVKATGKTTCEVTPVGRGSTTIYVSTQDGFVGKNSVSVTVKQPYAGITLDKSQLSLNEGVVGKLTATPSPETPDDFIVWSSDRPDIATVDNNGNVTALKAGTAIITAASKLRPTVVKATCTVTVTNPVIPVTGVSVSPATLALKTGENKTITATVTPANATNREITWWSTKESVATVSNGKVTAVAPGEAVICATTKDGGYSATCTVTVTSPVVEVTGISVSPATLTLNTGESGTITATIAPANATNKAVNWASSDTSVATVDNNGKVTAMSKEGTAIITATSAGNSGKSATCTVTVTRPVVHVTGVSVSPAELIMYKGESKTIAATITPSNAENKNVSWTSSNGAVASVNANGTVVAHSVGTAKITVTTEDGGHTATCNVTVKEKPVSVTSITLNKSSFFLSFGGSETINATIKPDNATNKAVAWTTSDPSVAKVDNNGKVTAMSKEGTATITATSEDNRSLSATCTVTVTRPVVHVTGISVSPAKLTLNIGESRTIAATITPSNAENKNVAWTSSNVAVASVNADGTVVARSVGTATITVTTEDGGYHAYCTVTVTSPVIEVTGISVSPATLTLNTGESRTITATIEPANATNKKVAWASSDTSVATVDNNGKITAMSKEGTATITATSAGNPGVKATCRVTVTRPVIPVTSIALNKTSATLSAGETVQLTATISPDNATNKTVTWSSSNTSVATVTNGKVTAKAAGSATITARSNNGCSAICSITVVEDGDVPPGGSEETGEEEWK